MDKEFSNLQELIKRQLLRTEDPAVLKLIQGLGHVREHGFFTKLEFLRMCNWKSPRPQRHFKANSEELIVSTSKMVFTTHCEETRLNLLIGLKGVGIPVASAILTLTEPTAYGVLDTRVWRLLYLYNEVTVKPSGTNFSTQDWLRYLEILRLWAKQFGVSVRSIERTLFEYHKGLQTGRLYNNRSYTTPTLF